MNYWCVSYIVEEHNGLTKIKKQIDTFYRLGVSITELRKYILSLAINWENLPDKKKAVNFIGSLNLGGVGELGKSVAKKLVEFCDKNFKGDRGWHFKVCMDEAECLSKLQQKVLNRLYRTSNNNLSYIASYVSLRDDLKETGMDKLKTQSADRDIHLLEDMSTKDFKKFAEGVTSVRLNKTLNRKNIKFSLDAIFGRLSLNKLLREILTNSESQKAKTLLDKAIALRERILDVKPPQKIGPSDFDFDGTDDLPIYQAYIIDVMDRDIYYEDREKMGD